jgi:hypothetical protein
LNSIRTTIIDSDADVVRVERRVRRVAVEAVEKLTEMISP